MLIEMQVSGHDIDEEPPALPQRSQPIPNSPPPSFHSRASSVSSRGHGRSNSRVDQTLADAFGANDDSDDEADDRQRLVRSAAGTSPSSSGVLSRTPATQGTSSAPSAHGTGTTASAAAGRSATSGRVYGGGVQSDGVFSNLTAKPEVGEKEEQPPVC